MAFTFQRVLRPFGEYGHFYAVRWNGRLIGGAMSWRSAWLVALNDGAGTWETAPETKLPILCGRREDVARRLVMLDKGLIEPGELT